MGLKKLKHTHTQGGFVAFVHCRKCGNHNDAVKNRLKEEQLTQMQLLMASFNAFEAKSTFSHLTRYYVLDHPQRGKCCAHTWWIQHLHSILCMGPVVGEARVPKAGVHQVNVLKSNNMTFPSIKTNQLTFVACFKKR